MCHRPCGRCRRRRPPARHREPLNADFLFRCHLLLILKMLQLACSGQQIKYGYARISGNRLTDKQGGACTFAPGANSS